MNIFQLFLGSFYSADAYRFMRAKANFGMGYALFVVVLVTFFVLSYFAVPIYTAGFTQQGEESALFDRTVRQIAEQAPLMTLKNDTLVTKDAEKTVITVKGEFQSKKYELPLITVDTTGKSTIDNTATPVLVTDKILYLNSNKKWEAHPLSEFTKDGPGTIIINHAVADEMATSFITYIHEHLTGYFFIAWIICIATLFVCNFFFLLTLGLIGLAMGSAIRSPLSFGAAVGLASLSFTPVALLDATLVTVFGYATHVVTLLLAGTVTLYAAIKCSDPKPTSTVAA